MFILDFGSGINEGKCIECQLFSQELELKISSESANLVKIRDRVREIAKHCNLTEKDAFDLQLAVGEAAANAIEHGSPKGSQNTIEVRANCNTSSIKISIVDQGNFIRRVQMPDTEEGIDFRGRGIPLMLALMDKVLIDEGTVGTRVVLEKKISNVGA